MQFATACEQQEQNHWWGGRCIIWSHFVYIQGLSNSHCRFSLGQSLHICHIVITTWGFLKAYHFAWPTLIQSFHSMPLTLANLLWPLDYGLLLWVTVVPCLIYLYHLGLEWSFVSLHCRIHEVRLSICPLLSYFLCVIYCWNLLFVCSFHIYFLKVNWATQRKKRTTNISWCCLPPSHLSPLSLPSYSLLPHTSSSSSLMEVIILAYLLGPWAAVVVDSAGKIMEKDSNLWVINKENCPRLSDKEKQELHHTAEIFLI